MNNIRNNSIISIDWLQISYLGEIKEPTPDDSGKIEKIIQLSDDLFVEYVSAGTKHFKCVWNLYYCGEKVGILVSHSRNPLIIDPLLLQVKFENHILYCKTLPYLINELNNSFKFNNITRVDIAIDTTSKVRDWIHDNVIVTKDYELKGKARLGCFNLNMDTGLFETYYVGSAKSDKKVRVYDKVLELSKSNKTYIEEYWKNNDLDYSNGVDRVEVVLKSKAIDKLDICPLQLLNNISDKKILSSVMRTSLKNFFQFVEKNGDTNRSRRDVIELIDWETIKGELLPKKATKPSSEVYTAKISIKRTFYEQIYNPDIDFTLTINHLIAKHSLEEWYKKKSIYWLQDFKIARMDIPANIEATI